MSDKTIIVAAADRAAAQAICADLSAGTANFTIPCAYASRGPITDPNEADWWGGSGEWPDEVVEALNLAITLQLRIFDNDPNVEPVARFDQHLAACDPPLARIVEGL